MQNKVNVAVVGVGYLGAIHARIYAKNNNVNLTGIFDTDKQRAQSIANEIGCAIFENIEQIINAVDAVSIVVPTSYHHQVTMPFILNGVHVLLEKPIATTVAQAQELVKTADEQGVILQIGHLERFNAGVVRLSELLDTPRFIEAHRLGEFTIRATDVDVITDLMIHDIDIILSLTKSKVKRISAVGSPVLTEQIDIANARLEFENGTVANVTASRVSRKKFRRMRVFAPDKYLAVDFNAQNVEIISKIGKTQDQQFPELKRELLDIVPVQPLDVEIQHFIDSIIEEKSPPVTGHDGLAALDVANQINQCIHNNPLN